MVAGQGEIAESLVGRASGLALALGGVLDPGFGGIGDLLCRLGPPFRRVQFAGDFLEAVALHQALAGGGRCAGGDGKTVPAPKRSVLGHQALAFREIALQAIAGRGVGDDADLAKGAGSSTPGPLTNWLNGVRSRPADAGRAGQGRQLAPAQGCFVVRRMRSKVRSSPRAAPSAGS